jgi:sulfoxide reductase heme-binding subunit YedZ
VNLAGRPARVSVWALGLLPLLALLWDFALDGLGPEPVERITHHTGKWALRMLLLCLAVTPLRRGLGWRTLQPHRRTLGLLAFTYASLHFATYLVFDLDFRFGELAEDVQKRPYITVGFATLALLALLAVTSTRGWMRRLGRRWTKLHRGVYLAAVGAPVHFAWSVKADLAEPLVYASVAGVLLALRLRPLTHRIGRSDANYATLPRSTKTGIGNPSGTKGETTEVW